MERRFAHFTLTPKADGSAAECVRAYHGAKFKGSVLKVGIAKPKYTDRLQAVGEGTVFSAAHVAQEWEANARAAEEEAKMEPEPPRFVVIVQRYGADIVPRKPKKRQVGGCCTEVCHLTVVQRRVRSTTFEEVPMRSLEDIWAGPSGGGSYSPALIPCSTESLPLSQARGHVWRGVQCGVHPPLTMHRRD